ncbi:hypothetical protein ACHAXA_011299 [Cyclostephanos tholiformis]|uniref:Uncharacterized protein n=1 Tax=Cyclostephanos tholiformis TaxID=382380 RepID=A0ABD3RWA1_9STRA
MRFHSTAAILSCLASVNTSSSVVSAFTSHSCLGRSFHHTIVLSSVWNNEESSSSRARPPSRELEQVFEVSSSAGAEVIAKMDLQERTKRAMLAELLEDRIFELVDELELLIKLNDGYESFSEFPVAVREEALEIAKQTKALQVQYDDLVNGRPSILLDLEGAVANDSLNPPSL